MGSLMTSRREERAWELEKEDDPSKRPRFLLSINKTVLNKIIVANELRIWKKEGRKEKERLIYRSTPRSYSYSLSFFGRKISINRKEREEVIKEIN